MKALDDFQSKNTIEIQPAQHCMHCVHKVYNPKTGTTCHLTGEKPNFRTSCSKIQFRDDIQESIASTNIHLKKTQQAKWTYYVNAGLYFFAGFALMVVGYLIGAYALDNRVISTVPLIIMGAGVLVLPLGVRLLVNYFQDLKAAQFDKKQLDALLSRYNKSYSVSISSKKEPFGEQSYQASVSMN